jgi:hypothetical protein
MSSLTSFGWTSCSKIICNLRSTTRLKFSTASDRSHGYIGFGGWHFWVKSVLGSTEPASLTNYFRDSCPTIDGKSDLPMIQTTETSPTSPLDMFLNSIGSKETKNKYRNKIDTFLHFVGLEGTLKERSSAFVDRATREPRWALDWIVRFLMQQKTRYDRREITAGTLRNYYKPLRVFCEANDVVVSWLKITRGLPKPRKFAQDRAPTSEEIRKVLEYPDRRIKPIVLMMSAGGFRVGAWDYLRWGHIEPTLQDGRVVAAKVRIYAGEAEEYATFITPEAYGAAKEWMDFRQEYGEKITPSSWVMRDLFRTAMLTYGAHYGMACAPKQLKSSGIRNMLKRAWVSQGLMK